MLGRQPLVNRFFVCEFSGDLACFSLSAKCYALFISSEYFQDARYTIYSAASLKIISRQFIRRDIHHIRTFYSICRIFSILSGSIYWVRNVSDFVHYSQWSCDRSTIQSSSLSLAVLEFHTKRIDALFLSVHISKHFFFPFANWLCSINENEALF